MGLPYILTITHHLLSDVLTTTLFTTINGLTRMSFPDAVTFLKTRVYLFIYYIEISQLVIVQGLHDDRIRLKMSTTCLIPEQSQPYIQCHLSSRIHSGRDAKLTTPLRSEPRLKVTHLPYMFSWGGT